MRKVSVGYVLLLVLLILVPTNLFIKEVKAEIPIYIRTDGSIDPASAPIQRNGEIYTLTEDFFTDNDGIIIERNQIILDGADHKLTGNYQQNQKGISLTNVQEVTVKNLEIESFGIGIMFWNASQTTIIGNRILNNLNQGIGFGGHSGDYNNQDNLIAQNFLSGNNVAMGPIEDGDLINSVIAQNQIVGNNNGLGIGTEGHSWINITINDNLMADNLGAAIYFITYKAPTRGISIINNEIRNNGEGICLDLWGVPDTLILDNIIAYNYGIGLSLEGTCNSTISGNIIEGNVGGLKLSHEYGDVSTATNNIISENTIRINVEYGIFLYGAHENQITNNVIANNSNGIILNSIAYEGYDILSNNNLIAENQITQNTDNGIQLIRCNDNLLNHNRFVDNLLQVYSEDSINIWDDGLNGGNFWSDYSGIDANHDGIGDTPYIIDEVNQDNYPLLPLEAQPSEFILTVSVVGSGSTSPSVGNYSYDEGSSVSVSAYESFGWVFDYWLFDSVNGGSTNPYTVTMDDNHSLAAVFTENSVVDYILSLSVSGSGSTSPSVGTHSYVEGSEVAVTAYAGSGWKFDHWELEGVEVGNSNPHTVTMHSSHSLAAYFVEVPTEVNDDEPFKVTNYNVIIETNTYIIETCSNSSVSDFVLNPSLKQISFNVNGTSGTTGFCNITIPTELLSGVFSIYKDNTELIKNVDYTETYNGTRYIFSIKYDHSTHMIEIIATNVIPEFPSWIILPLLVTATISVILYRKKLKDKTIF